MTDTKVHPMPSSLPPTEAELAAWNLLTRDEQIAHYREYLAHPDFASVSAAPPWRKCWRKLGHGSHGGVASFRLSDRARAEQIAIYDYSEAHFGVYQADAYLAGLERTFGLLADFPGIGQAADHLEGGYRRFRFRHISYSMTRMAVALSSARSFMGHVTSGPSFSTECHRPHGAGSRRRDQRALPASSNETLRAGRVIRPS